MIISEVATTYIGHGWLPKVNCHGRLAVISKSDDQMCPVVMKVSNFSGSVEKQS